MSSLNEAGFLSTEIHGWIQKHRKANEKWFSLSERCSSLGQQVLLSLKINNNDLQQILVSLWFNRLLSHFQAIILLMERGMLYEAQILLGAASGTYLSCLSNFDVKRSTGSGNGNSV